MKKEIVAVVGATGKTGGRVLAKLQQRGYITRGLSRSSEYVFDWSDRATWAAALVGVDSAYITYFPDLAVTQAHDDMLQFVREAKTQGVKHIVLLSGRGEEGAARAERVVQTSGLDWNIVRASWFMHNFSESFMLDGINNGKLVLPKPKADEPFIDVDDIVDVALAALTRSELRNQLFEITGPELLSFKDCIERIGAASGRAIGFETVSVEAYLADAKEQGLPEGMAWLIHELFENVLDGRNASITNTIQSVLGRPAKTFDEYVSATVPTGIWSEKHVNMSA